MITDFTLKQYSRGAGVLLLLSIIGGGLGEFYILSRLLVPNNPAATAANISGMDFTFRFGFAAYLVEALCDVALVFVFYQLLKHVHKGIALLTVLLGLVSTITFAFSEFFYYATTLVLRNDAYLDAFSREQREALAFLLIKFYHHGGGIFLMFYGFASLLRGYLIFKSGYIPKFFGLALILAGLCFVIRNFLFVLWPAYATDWLLVLMPISLLGLSIWLLVKGAAAPNMLAR